MQPAVRDVTREGAAITRDSSRIADQDFAAFYAAAYPRVVAALTSVAGSRHEAEDVAQEAFSRLVPRCGGPVGSRRAVLPAAAAVTALRRAARRVSVNLSTVLRWTEVDDRRVSQAVPGRGRYGHVPNDPDRPAADLVTYRHLSDGDDRAHDDMPVEFVIGLGRLMRPVLSALGLLRQQRPSRQVQLRVQVAVMADVAQ